MTSHDTGKAAATTPDAGDTTVPTMNEWLRELGQACPVSDSDLLSAVTMRQQNVPRHMQLRHKCQSLAYFIHFIS